MALLLFSSSHFYASAQVKADSLQHIWEDKTELDKNRFLAFDAYYKLMVSATPSAVVNSSKIHFELAKSVNSKKEMALALDNKAHALSLLGQFDEAIKEIEISYQLAEVLNDSFAMASKQANIGSIYYYQSNYQEAVRHLTKSLSIFERQNKYSKQADILNNLGLIFLDITNYDLALEYFERALVFYEKAKRENEIGNIWINIAATYFDKGNLEKAQFYIKKATGIFQKTNNKIGLADCHNLLALLYQKKGEINLAVQEIEKSLQVNIEIGNEYKIMVDKTLLATLWINKHLKEATKLGEEVLELSKLNGDISLKVKVYKLLHTCYKKQNKLEQSLAMLENYTIYHDSLLMEENNMVVIKEAIQGEFAIKLFNNQLQNEQIQADLKLRQTKRLFTIILFSLILFSLLFFYFQHKRSQDKKLRETLLQEIDWLKSHPKGLNTEPQSYGFHLNREKIEIKLNRKLNETDWKVLTILVDDPVISNQEIAEKAFLSTDGIGSSLRRMYEYFEIKESKYKKISLLLEAIKISNQ
ncbi:MAG: tetratricopeptide repeat protein [Bacteroidia bacterium]|nr:tetratricopeptide repeat protein [Bacteroidia bacterium]